MTFEPAADAPVSADSLAIALLERCTFAPSGTAVRCALSGGPDSTALVALAVTAGLDVTAVHIDHGLRPDSAHDADLARDTAHHLGVAFRCERIELSGGANLEARARFARRKLTGPDALTGHTADDQAETLILNLLRGAGAAGLAAMRPGPSKPILALRRAETHQLCDLLQLTVASDPTNTDPRFRRNRVRGEVMALLNDVAERDLTPVLVRTSSLLRDDETLLDELASAIDPHDAVAVAAAPLPLARRAIRRWIIDTMSAASSDATSQKGHPPDYAAVERILAVARGDAAGCDVTGLWRVERSQQRLRLFSATATSG